MIVTDRLTKRFGETHALMGVSLQVQKGSIFGLVGSNGAGKSTLLRILSGVYRADGGEAAVDGRDPFENEVLKCRMRLLPDELWYPGQSTVLGVGKALRHLYPGWDQEYFQELCRMFPVDENAKYAALSKGNRKQMGIILSLASRPDILLLDEPFDGLDPVVRKLTKKLLAQEVAGRQMTIVLATHELRELEDFCDTLALLHRGGVVLEKELDDMRLQLQKVQAVFPETPDMEELRRRVCVASCQHSGSLLTIVARGSRDQVLKGVESFSPSFCEALPLSLEEVFICEMEASGYDLDNILG